MSDEAISSEDVAKITAAAATLIDAAFVLVDNNPHFTIGALSLALGTAGAAAKLPFDQLVDLLSKHYEGYLLGEVAEEMEAAGTTIIVPSSEEGNN